MCILSEEAEMAEHGIYERYGADDRKRWVREVIISGLTLLLFQSDRFGKQ